MSDDPPPRTPGDTGAHSRIEATSVDLDGDAGQFGGRVTGGGHNGGGTSTALLLIRR